MGAVGFKVVPWSCDQEWKHTFDLLYSQDICEQTLGIEIVEIWRIRSCGSGKVSLCIELTADLVQCKIVLNKIGSCIRSRLLMSAALIRFVTLLADLDQVKKHKEPISKLCSHLGIPIWITELRNESAHSSLPATDVALTAIDICLDYLKDNYWFPHWYILFEITDQTCALVQKLMEKWIVTKCVDEQNVIKALQKVQMEPQNVKSSNSIICKFVIDSLESYKHLIFVQTHDSNPIDCCPTLNPFVTLWGVKFVHNVLTAEFVIKSGMFPQLFAKFFEKFLKEMNGELQCKEILASCLSCASIDFFNDPQFVLFVNRCRKIDVKFDFEKFDQCLSLLRKRNDIMSSIGSVEDKLAELEIVNNALVHFKMSQFDEDESCCELKQTGLKPQHNNNNNNAAIKNALQLIYS